MPTTHDADVHEERERHFAQKRENMRKVLSRIGWILFAVAATLLCNLLFMPLVFGK